LALLDAIVQELRAAGLFAFLAERKHRNRSGTEGKKRCGDLGATS